MVCSNQRKSFLWRAASSPANTLFLSFTQPSITFKSKYNNQQQADKRIIGFDCEFVKPPPSEYVQSECPVCLQIIREPHQVTCCGKKFCKACIEHIRAIQKPCPTCNEEFSSFADKGLKQSLYSLKVRCSHQKDGCEWTN